ncbi:MAG: hypothetical protein PHI85_10805 [Victivallaceae bacterium]|nr:hypothetical protein [Victivallaceae bacterium]
MKLSRSLALTGALLFNTALAAEFHPDKQRATWKFVTIHDQMYFDWNDEDFDKLAKTFADHGVTHAMTFNSTHYLWNFYRHFDKMATTVEKLCTAFHKYGIFVIEHHSATIMYSYLPGEPRNGSAYWPDYEADMNLNTDCHGVPVGSLFQVSARTGKPLFTSLYHNYATCFNNPDFRRIYFDYLATLYAAGLDGILADDLWFMTPESCACEHCRKLFKTRYGFDLPTGDEWDKVMADKESEIYTAWQDFRYASIVDFADAVGDDAVKRGYTKLLYPHYCAAGVSWKHIVPVTLDDYRYIDWSFQEAFGGALRYSFPEYLVEAQHRSMVGRWHKAPPMSLGCPATRKQREFFWMLCLYAGHIYLPDDRDNKTFPEQPMRDFEKLNYDIIAGFSPFARVAIYDSSRNRQLDVKYSTLSGAIAQTMIFGNQPFIYAGRPDFTLGTLEKCELLIVPEVRFMNDDEIASIRSFAENGGHVFWLGESGSRTYKNYGRRSPQDVAALLGDCANIEKLPADALFVRPLERVLAWNCDLVPPEKWQPPTDAEKYRRARILDLLRSKLTGPQDIVSDAPDGMLISSLLNPDTGAWTAHILNTVGALDRPAAPDGYRMSDELPYPENAAFSVTLRKPDDRRITRVAASALHGEPADLEFSDNDRTVTVKIPEKMLKEHLVLSIK